MFSTQINLRFIKFLEKIKIFLNETIVALKYLSDYIEIEYIECRQIALSDCFDHYL